jgi:signal transduction histidine kinase
MLLRLGARNAPADACTVLLESAAHVRRALDCLRETIVSLRNPGGRPGLAESLSAAVADARATGDIDVRLDIRDVPPLSEAVEDALTVVACEAVANAARHAGGSCITVSLGEHAGTIRLTVEDNGRGADPVAMMRRRAEGGQGVALMREQVHRVGGTYTIARKPEGGTAVTAVVPVRTVSATSGGTRRMPAATPAAAVH